MSSYSAYEASDPEIIFAVQNVSRSFGATHALDNLSLNVYRGEVFAVLGPNGAGKTTLAYLLQGLLAPDSGQIVFYRGATAKSRLDADEMGYFPGDSSIYKTLPLNRILYHAGLRRGMTEDAAHQAAYHWLTRLDLTNRSHTSLANLSRGNQQKVQFAEAVIHTPDILFLDEPFANLDPVNQELFVALIREVQAQGTTILLNDHQMSLVERLANRIAILDQGRLIALGTLNELRTHVGSGLRVRVRLLDPAQVAELGYLYEHPAVYRVERTASGEIRILTRDETVPVDILNFVKSRLQVGEILAEPVNLHDIYVQLLTQQAQSE